MKNKLYTNYYVHWSRKKFTYLIIFLCLFSFILYYQFGGSDSLDDVSNTDFFIGEEVGVKNKINMPDTGRPSDVKPILEKNSPEQLFQEMISWAKANGAFVKEGIYVGYDKYGVRGVYTEEHIKVNETILSIPFNLIIFATGRCAGGKYIAPQNMADEMKKGEDSFYYPYIRMLPTLEDFKTQSPYFLPNELQLAFEPLIKQLKLFDCKLDLQDGSGTLASLCQWTRAYNYNKTHSGFIPISDFANSGMVTNTEWIFEPEKERFKLYAYYEIAKNTQLTETYTIRGNDYLYSGWGFIDPDNEVSLKGKLTKDECRKLKPACKKYKNDPNAYSLGYIAFEMCPGECSPAPNRDAIFKKT